MNGAFTISFRYIHCSCASANVHAKTCTTYCYYLVSFFSSLAFNAVFTTLGAYGRYGPISLGSHYTGEDHDGQVTLFEGIQQWTVPYDGEYKIEAIGAAGGYDSGLISDLYRGRGARMIGTFRLSRGEKLNILVGQEGGINYVNYASGGGGGTFVANESFMPLIVAGGG